MRRNQRHGMTAVVHTAALMLLLGLVALVAAPIAAAQDTNDIVRSLEADGYYIESDGDATDAEMRRLVSQASGSNDEWYFVVLAGPADFEYAADLRDLVQPIGNVIVASVEEDSQGFYDQVDFATSSTEAIEERALAAFDGDWDRPADYMSDVIDEFNSLTTASSNSGSSNSGSSSSGTASSGSSNSGGGGFPWPLVAIPAALGGGIWFISRRGKKKKAEADLDTAQKIRTEIQAELDELANDVLVLSGPVDLSEKPDVVTYYREATNTYLDISDEIPDPEKLGGADLQELSKIGARVAHARWQMDAAEALIAGEPLPEKPKVEPPPPPPPAAPQQQQRREQRRQQMPQRAPRARVPYSRSRRRSGGGLLDVLIAGAGMMGASRGRRGGSMFGGSSRSRSASSAGSRSRQSGPRAGGGVFGGGSRSSASNRSSRSKSRSSSSRSSRSSSRRSSGGRSTSKRRRR